MEDDEHVPTEDADHELEAQVLAVVKKIVPALRVAKNTAKVLRRLSSVGIDALVAGLEAGTSWFHLKKARNEHLIAQLAELSNGESTIGVKVAERLIEEQRRIDQLVFAAIEHVQSSGSSVPSEEIGGEEGGSEIDSDWIESFRREAADRSQGEMRETFARILAGEICEPGTFSIKTLRTVGALSQSTANLFRKAASLRVGMEVVAKDAETRSDQLIVLDARIPALDGKLGENCLQSEGLDYGRLIQLTENGLLHPDYNSWHNYNLAIFGTLVVGRPAVPFIHQNQKWALLPLSNFKTGSELRIHGAKFTTVGQELLHIVDIENDPVFLDNVQAYLKNQHVEIVPFPSSAT